MPFYIHPSIIFHWSRVGRGGSRFIKRVNIPLPSKVFQLPDEISLQCVLVCPRASYWLDVPVKPPMKGAQEASWSVPMCQGQQLLVGFPGQIGPSWGTRLRAIQRFPMEQSSSRCITSLLLERPGYPVGDRSRTGACMASLTIEAVLCYSNFKCLRRKF